MNLIQADRSVEFWKERLSGAPALLELPTDHPRLAIQPFKAATEQFVIANKLTKNINTLCKKEDASLFSVLMTTLQILLHRYSGQGDICVGGSIDNQQNTKVGKTINDCLSIIVIRSQIAGESSCRKLLQQVNTNILKSQDQQDMPFNELLDTLNIEKNLSYTPIFQVLLTINNMADKKPDLSGPSSSTPDSKTQSPHYDLIVDIMESPKGLIGKLTYNIHLFDPSTIQRISSHYQLLLKVIIDNLHQTIAAVPFLSKQERKQLVVDWNNTKVVYPQDKCIHEMYEKQVKKTPDAIAVVFEEQQLTYQELNRKSNQLAHHLIAQGVGPEIKVGLSVERSLKMIIGILGIMKAGGAYVPIDPEYPQQRIDYLYTNSGIHLLLTQADLLNSISERNNIPYFCLDKDWAEVTSYSAINPTTPTTSANLAYIIYTSGSTGNPKGVMCSHKGLVNRLEWMQKTYQLTSNDRILQKTPFSFDVSVWEFLWPLITGAQLNFSRPDGHKDPSYLGNVINEQAITTLHFVPSMLEAFISAAPTDELPSLKRVICSGEALSASLEKKFFALFNDVELHNLYGPTEASIDVSFWECITESGYHSVPIGKPIDNTQLYILDSYFMPVPISTTGELYIGGEGLARGYLNRADLTADRFIPNSFNDASGTRLYKTGDLARHLPDGNIEYIGRTDHQVKVRGFRIELGEIEYVLSTLPHVREAVILALSRGEDVGNQYLTGYVILDDKAVLDSDQLKNMLKETLPDYMIPSFFVFLDELPLTSNGKVDRKALPVPDADDLLTQDYIAPCTETEKQLTEIWANVLNLPAHKLGTNAKFLELGGHSLLATRIASQIRQDFNTDISLADVFYTDTIQSLALVIDDAKQQPSVINSYAVPLVPVDRTQPQQLSFAQQRLWFMHELEGGTDTRYNEPLALRLRGSIEVTALQEAMQTIVQRHEILRTSYDTLDGEPIQIIADTLTLDIPVIETSEDSVPKFIDKHMTGVFDLTTGPLIKVSILCVSSNETILLINMHHIVCDGWSMEVFGHELAKLYDYYKADNSPQFPLLPLPVQYADVSHWQRQWLQGEILEQQLNYWKTQLDGAAALLELPTDRPRPATQSYSGSRYSFNVPAALTEKLRRLSQQSNITLFMTLFASFNVLLSRYSGQDDICVATPVANRQRKELENLIGFFVNTLVLRTTIDRKTIFSDFLQRVKTTALEAYSHQDIPFESLVDILKPERSLSYSPLFQVMFALQDPPETAFKLTDTTVSLIDVNICKSKFDLTLFITEEKQGLAGVAEFNTDLFDPTTIERLFNHYIVLLEGITENPHKNVYDFPLLTKYERQQILFDWNNTETDYPKEKCIHKLFEEHVQKRPEAAALVYEDQQLTYQELNQKSNQLAHYLIAQGLGPEVRVGLCVERSLEMIIGLLGILKAGGAYVPIDPEYPQQRVNYITKDSNIEVMLTQKTLLRNFIEHKSINCICLDNDSSEFTKQSIDTPESGVHSTSIAYVIYTSGSTGVPKGVAVPHKSVNRLVINNSYIPLHQERNLLQASSISFDAATFEIWGALLNGSQCILYPERVPTVEKMEELIINRNIDTLWVTTGLFNLLVDEKPEIIKHLNYVLTGGEVASKSHITKAKTNSPNTQIVNMYGPTENTTFSTSYALTIDNLNTLPTIPIGKPISNTTAYILSPELDPVPIGVVGELYVGGDGLANGYQGKSNLTNEKFIPHPFDKRSGQRLYKTGDLTRYLPDGNIEFFGRVDNQIKIRGFRIEMGEIENILTQKSDVREAVVLDHITDTTHYLIAYLVPESSLSSTTKPTTLRTELQLELPDYMVPSIFIFLDELPLTPNGKVDRKALPIPDTESLLTQEYVAPRTDIEHSLIEIWSELLNLSVEKVGIHDNFFELGGDSILSIQVASRAHKQGISITTRQLFEHQTIEQLAHYAKKSAHEIDQKPCQGELSLLPIQHWFFKHDSGDLYHFHQSFLLHVPTDFDIDFLRHFVLKLYQRHDALRLKFTSNSNASWHSEFVPFDTELVNNVVTEEPLIGEITSQRQAHLATRGESIKSRFDLENGQLIKATYFKADQPEDSRLLFVIHHLIVDGVSWRVLLDDLSSAFEQWQSDTPLALPAKTSSIQQWGARLTSYSQSDTVTNEKPYWLTMLSPAPPIPVDHSVILNDTWGDSKTIDIQLSKADTQALLNNCHQAYHTQINDLLLSALLLAFFRWRGLAALNLHMEGHGREDLFDDIDLTGTLGWFTSVYPLRLSLPQTTKDNALIDELIKTVKEQYRAIPNKGIGYGLLRYLAEDEALAAAEQNLNNTVVFNYLGQFDQQLGQQQAFYRAQESTGSDIGPTLPRADLLGFNGSVINGCLQFSLDYNHHQYHPETMIELGQAYEMALKDVIAHCQLPEVGSFTPSDFPLAALSQTDVDHWQQQHPRLVDIYPATGMQAGLLFHNLLDDDAAYVVHITWQLQGDLTASELKYAWDTVVARHAGLRTAFAGLGNEQLLQIIVDQVELPWVEVDWRHLSEKEQATAFETYRLADKAKGFTHDQAPLMRCALFRETDSSYRFLWTQHHSILDGWCLPIILDEVMTCYRQSQAGHPVNLPVAASYRNYIQWLQHQDQQAAKDFWQQQLQGITAPTALGIDKLPVDKSIVGPQTYQHQVTKELTNELQQVARRYRITLNTLMQAAWAYVLHRYSGDETIIFGETVSGRPTNLLHAEDMVGLFINTQPVCITVDDKMEIKTWLQQLHQLQAQRASYSYLPLVDIESCSEISGGHNSFNTLMVFENYPMGEVLNDNVTENSSSILLNNIDGFDETHYDLSLSIYPGENLHLKVMYKPDTYAAETIERTAQHIAQVLTGLTDHTNTHLDDLPLLTETEKRKILIDWNNTEVDYPQDKCIHQLFEEQAHNTPNAIAVVFEDQQLTYQDLNQKSNQLAHYLIQHGVTPDTRIGISVERSFELVVGLLGILKSGAAYVPLDPSYPKDRLAYMLVQADIDILLSQQALREQFPTDLDVVILDDDAEWLSQDSICSNNLTVAVKPEHLAYVIFTSGSTGRPKAVAMPHSALTNLIHWQVEQSNCGIGANTLQFSAFSFDVSFQELFSTWCSGGTLVLIDEEQRKDPFALWHVIDQQRINRLFMPFIALQQLAEVYSEVADQLTNTKRLQNTLQEIITAGEQLQITPTIRTLFQQFPHCKLHNHYGPSETHVCTALALEGPPDTWEDFPTIGQPIANNHIYILDSTQQPVPIGVYGELYVGGTGLALGYLNREDLTTERFIENPLKIETEDNNTRLYKTGDLARYRADGTIEYQGRIDGQVKIRGYRIEPGEIEAILAKQPGVKEAIIGIHSRSQGSQDKYLAAYIVAKEDITLEEIQQKENLQKAVQKILPEYMVPSVFIFLDSLPLTPSGKVDRKALPAPDENSLLTQEYIAPRTEIESTLIDIWSGILNIPSNKIGIQDNFFDLGGHSLLATRVVVQIRKAFDIEIQIRDLFTLTTIEILSEKINKKNHQRNLVNNLMNKTVISDTTDTEEMRI